MYVNTGKNKDFSINQVCGSIIASIVVNSFISVIHHSIAIIITKDCMTQFCKHSHIKDLSIHKKAVNSEALTHLKYVISPPDC